MSDLIAIDVHVHPNDAEWQRAAGARTAQMQRYFGRGDEPVPMPELADQYRARRMKAVLMNTRNGPDAEVPGVPNERLAAVVRADEDVFLGFGAIDPHDVRGALEEIRRIADLGLRGIGELNPGRQKFSPNDERFYPLWSEAARLGLIVVFHTGMLGAGAGTPGGMGFKLKYTDPMLVDDVAADFPDLRIVLAHPSWPYQPHALAIARHKANVWLDLSGWAPKYWEPELVRYARSVLRDRVLFGSDWPVLAPERWLEEFEAYELPDDVRQGILLENARHLLGI